MNRRRAMTVWGTLLVLMIVIGAVAAIATNRWGCWKYANASVNVYNGSSGDYAAIWNEEVWTDGNSWNPYTDLVLTQVGSAGSTDHANMYAGYYGANGWLGLASISSASGSRPARARNGRSPSNSSLNTSVFTVTNTFTPRTCA